MFKAGVIPRAVPRRGVPLGLPGEEREGCEPPGNPILPAAAQQEQQGGTAARSDSSGQREGTEGPCSRGTDGENWAEYPQVRQNQPQGYSPGVEDGCERGVSTWEQREDGAGGQGAHRGRKEARRKETAGQSGVVQGTQGLPAGRESDLKAD